MKLTVPVSINLFNKMFLNLVLPGSKVWKPYWVEIKGCWLDISAEYGKEPFTSFHIGVLKVRPSKEYPDRPNVLEFYDGDGFTQVHFYVFTYDPFDILDFFKSICDEYKKWRSEARAPPAPVSCDVKPIGLFQSNQTWTVYSDKITYRKPGKDETAQTPLSEISSITPSANSSHVAYFKFTGSRQNSDPVEQKCSTLDQMKALLNAFYTNRFLASPQANTVQQAPAAAPAPEPAPAPADAPQPAAQPAPAAAPEQPPEQPPAAQ